jgi:hypothetical protein
LELPTDVITGDRNGPPLGGAVSENEALKSLLVQPG